MNQLPVLGVGLTYSSGLEPMLKECRSQIGVLEVEPQTLWFRANQLPDRLRLDEEFLAHIQGLPFPKLIHSIGFPVGGTQAPDRAALRLLRRTADILGVPWMSEHLSFNRAPSPEGKSFNTGFLLPPRQTWAGVAAAAESIRRLTDEMGIPVAVETGVNYLRRLTEELPDGAFVAEVVERADCGILLDLHNVWTNERNGRQAAEEYIAQLPLERVFEVHLAGGFERDGYWLDSHSGPVPSPLLELAASILPRIPSLGALIFELFPAYLPSYGLSGIASQLPVLRSLWDARRTAVTPRPVTPVERLQRTDQHDAATPAEWESVLGALVLGGKPSGSLAEQLTSDGGVKVFRDLLGEFRRSMVASAYTLTTRLLLLTLGEHRVNQLFSAYWSHQAPELFASAEGDGFATFVESLDLDVPWLGEIIRFERARLRAVIDGATEVVRFPGEPFRVLDALAKGELPAASEPGDYEVEITPDLIPQADALRALHAQPAPH